MKTTARVPMMMLAALVAILLSGCGSSGGDNPVQPQNDEVEPNDFTAQSLDTLSTTDLAFDASAGGLGDVDLFSVVLAAPAGLFVNVAGATDLELSISNNQGVFVRHVDTVGNSETCTLAGLPVGTYTIRIASFASTATNYHLTVGAR